MRVQFCDVGKRSLMAGAAHPLLEGADLSIETGARVGILGTDKAETGSLLRLICGTEYADEGRIERSGRISWPIPQSSILSPNSTVLINIRFMARLYGVSDALFAERIAATFELGEFLNAPLISCPPLVKQRLALAIPLGIGFDLYLFEQSLAPVDKSFRERAKELVSEITAGSGLVLATANPAEAKGTCNSVYVLEAGRVRFFPDADEGMEFFKKLVKAQRSGEGGPADSDRASEDVGDELIGDIDVIGTAVASAIE